MSRKTSAPKRDVLPDPLWNSQLVTRLINRVMLDGKRGTAASIVYGPSNKLKIGNDALKYSKQLWKTSCLYLKYVYRVGSSNYQVPVEVRPERRTTLDFVGW